MQEYIHVKGAREHNLKNIDIKIPRDKLVVFTGLSGSGKSSLAFDTIYAEGQRRYVESLSSYARQFLGQMDKPDVDYIDGLSPAISIDQKTTSQNPRSTVGTVTEIYDYMRLLWARIGTPHCPKCGKEIHQQTIDQIIDRLMALEEKTRVQLLAPVIRGKKGEHVKVFENARKQGYVRVRVDGEIHDLSEEFKLAKTKKHNIEIVVDRVVIRPDARGRITDSVETASALSGGLVIADVIGGEPLTFSQNYACDDCGISIEELTPRECSRSTTRTARARCAPVWASRSALTRTASFRTATFPSSRALSARPAGGAPTRAASRRCTTTHSAKSTALRWKRPSRSSPSRHSTSCCTAPEMSRSSCRSAAFRAA